MKFILNDWKMKYCDYDEMDCRVPCSLYSVLLENQIILDPLFGCNESKYYSLADNDVFFYTDFLINDSTLKEKSVNVVFEGVDTLSEIKINGKTLAKTDNMHRKYKIDIKSFIVCGDNRLEVHIKSPTKFMKNMYDKDPVWSLSCMYKGQPYLRKALYMGGWDWGPRIMDMGIWKPVYIEAYSNNVIEDFSIRQIHNETGVKIKIKTFVSNKDDETDIMVEFDNKSYIALNGECEIKVNNPKIWWPNGLGEQPIYKLKVLIKKGETIIDKMEKHIGLRTITISDDCDKWGREFCFKVNGKKIFAKGANYIPEKNILSELCYEDTYNLIDSCKKANFNCIRVWGGGYYPDDYFYDICDEMGIIVWNDFMFACMDINLSKELEENIKAEAKQQVKRIAHHASLGILCGNNEIEDTFKNWGRPMPSEKILDDYNRLFYKILPQICSKYAPDTYYWPSSPSSYGSLDLVQSQNEGDTHTWYQWQYGLPLDALKNDYSRFCSEFGIQSFPSMDVLRNSVGKDELALFTDAMNNHQKAAYMSTAKILRYIGEHYGFVSSLKDIVFASQVCQSEGVRYAVEHYRRNRGRCMGALYWQLNDIWPAVSWSSIDCSGTWKALHYAAKKFFESIHLSAYVEDGKVCINVSNESLENFDGYVLVKVKNMDLKVLMEESISVTVSSLSTVYVKKFEISEEISENKSDIFAECVLYDETGEKISNSTVVFEVARKLNLKPVDINYEIMKDKEDIKLCLYADKFVRNLFIDIYGEDIVFSDNYFDITSREKSVIKFRTKLNEDEIRAKIRFKSDVDVIKRPRALL